MPLPHLSTPPLFTPSRAAAGRPSALWVGLARLLPLLLLLTGPQVDDPQRQWLAAWGIDSANQLALTLQQLVDQPERSRALLQRLLRTGRLAIGAAPLPIRGIALLDQQATLHYRAGELPALPLLRRTLETQPLSRQLHWRYRGRRRLTFLAPLYLQQQLQGYALLTLDPIPVTTSRPPPTGWPTAPPLAPLLLLALLNALVWQRPALRTITTATDRRDDELQQLIGALNQLSHGLLRRPQLEQLLWQDLAPPQAQRLLADLDQLEPVELGGRQLHATVLFADIVGFSQLAERLTPAAVSALLNDYFQVIGEAVARCDGHIDKYIGDAAMVLFGAPQSLPHHTLQALRCGWQIQRRIAWFNRQRQRSGLATVQFRIGINSGLMLAGHLGSRARMEYTVVGDAVNLAARLCQAAAPGAILFSAELWHEPTLVGTIRAVPEGVIRLRGRSRPTRLFRLTGLNRPHA